MRRLSIFVLTSAVLALSSGCASKGYVRKSVNASADTLTARIETNEGEMREIRDNADKKIAAVDAKYDTKDSILFAVTCEMLTSVQARPAVRLTTPKTMSTVSVKSFKTETCTT
jgi:hypothetical protein